MCILCRGNVFTEPLSSNNNVQNYVTQVADTPEMATRNFVIHDKKIGRSAYSTISNNITKGQINKICDSQEFKYSKISYSF
jgi:hypothetical protein